MVEPKVEDKVEDKIEKIEPKKDEIVSEEKTELQKEVEELKKKNHDLEAVAGRVSGLNTMINNLETTVDEKINNLLNARQPVKEDDVVGISDDDYVMGKDVKRIVDTEVKKATGNQEEAVEKILTAREGKKTQYDKEYLQEVAKLTSGISDEETFKGVLGEMDANFRKDTGNAKEDAESNYIKGENSYLKKANASGRKIEFGSGKPPVAPLGVGNPGGEKIITKPEKEIEVPEDAKELLLSIESNPEKRKVLAKEALG